MKAISYLSNSMRSKSPLQIRLIKEKKDKKRKRSVDLVVTCLIPTLLVIGDTVYVSCPICTYDTVTLLPALLFGFKLLINYLVICLIASNLENKLNR